MAGHRVRIIAPDDSVRGTARIESVTNQANSVTVDGFVEVRTTDGVDYSGYLLHAPNGLGGKRFVAVRRNGAQWEYDNDAGFVSFTPSANDSLFASFTKSGNTVVRLDLLRC